MARQDCDFPGTRLCRRLLRCMVRLWVPCDRLCGLRMAGRDACCAFRLVGGGVGDAVRASWRNPTFQVLLENSFQDARDTDTMPRLRRFLCALFCLIVRRL